MTEPTDIRNGTDDEIRAEVARVLGCAVSQVRVLRDLRDEVTVRSIDVIELGPVSFMKLTELAGACMTPEITVAADYGGDRPTTDLHIRWP